MMDKPNINAQVWALTIDRRMVGKSKDPKGTRITVRISDKDLAMLQAEARRKNTTVGAVVRTLIRECLPQASHAETHNESASG